MPPRPGGFSRLRRRSRASRPLAARFCRDSNRSLHLILLPTESCNFRCVYCYEDFRPLRMSPDLVRGVKALLALRAPELEDLAITWFGGEPLLARDIIEDVMGHVRALAESNPRLRVVSDAVTNGYFLTPSRAERLLDLGVSRYQISFDGTRAWHDRKRVLASGRGTFDRIWGNVLALRDLRREFTVTLRVHVDRENEAFVPQWIDECAAAFAGDSRFEVFVRGLSRFGGPNDDRLSVFGETDGEAAFERLRAYARSRDLRTMRSSPDVSVCYAARANSFVVRADGRLNKCTISLNDPENDVGRLREDGTLDVDSRKLAVWMRGFWSRNPQNLECPMKGLAER